MGGNYGVAPDPAFLPCLYLGFDKPYFDGGAGPGDGVRLELDGAGWVADPGVHPVGLREVVGGVVV